jgi:uncharacterized protein (DUF362 family)
MATTRTIDDLCFDPRLAAAALPAPAYADGDDAAEAQAAEALSRLARQLGWADADDGAGADEGAGAGNGADADGRGAFARVIPPGARVLVKPNFVTHENAGPWGMLPLVTHGSVVRAAVAEALRAAPSEVLVGDAPIQGCDFAELLKRTRLDAWADELRAREPRFKGVRDFRRTTSVFVGGVRVAEENKVSADRFVLFDLGADSLLEPVTDRRESFRVTCYDPRQLARTHAPGRHQYLVAREVIEADVIINLPKLKTHKKAGVTCALKNLIGINGNKEYLPHHRVGGAAAGGDCYAGQSRIKNTLEFFADRQNTTDSFARAKVWRALSRPLFRTLRALGESLDLEGSWSGNDTIWRTCLDLNRVLLYGRADGTLADRPQRKVLHVVDAVVAGQGDGPLAPQPLPLGLMFAGSNAAAVDWAGAHLLGYDPARITVAREAFGEFRWPLTRFARRDITIGGDLGDGAADELLPAARNSGPVIYPAGWRDAVAATTGGARSAARNFGDETAPPAPPARANAS